MLDARPLLSGSAAKTIEQTVVVEVCRLPRDAVTVQAADRRRLQRERAVAAIHEERGSGFRVHRPAPVEHHEILPAVVVEIAEHRVGEVRAAVAGVHRRAGARSRRRSLEEPAPVAIGPVERRQPGRLGGLLEPEPALVPPEPSADVFRARSPTGAGRADGEHVEQPVVVHVGQ
jgi:hypothetical protein